MHKPIYQMTPKHSHFTENYGIKIWGEEFGGMICAVHHFAPGTDITPSFKAFGGFCPVPHWGYCFKGEMIMRYDDGTEEIVKAGDMFYLQKGHTMIIDKNAPVDCEIIQFSNAADFAQGEDKVAKTADNCCASSTK